MPRWRCLPPLAWLAPVGMLAPLGMLAAIGCAKLPAHRGSHFAPETSDAVALDVFFVSYPFGDETVNSPLFAEIDPQEIPLDVRRRLADNGFLAGIVGGQLPPIVGELLQLADSPPADHPPDTSPPNDSLPVVDVAHRPRVRRQLLKTFHADDPASLLTSGKKEAHSVLTVLFRDDGDPPAVRGGRYYNAKTILSTKIEPQGDGRVQLELLPVVEHGEPRRDIVAGDGGFTVKVAAPRKTFDTLRMAATLSPGQILVVSCRTDRPGSLGHQFFTQRFSDRLEQVVLLIRLAQARPAELFAEETSDVGE
ncbi:MAG TPA: hypothetical protein VJ783_01690 [Pirellulales bacterium]|nr:hypothetical protein [Pirellulales bacterium]